MAKQASRKPAKTTETGSKSEPALLSGGNPQIAKGYGNEPVQAYIAAMPGWKSEVGRKLDVLIETTLPDVRKAVKWNSSLYGIDGETWFLGIHCFNTYIKLAFFCGKLLDPMPPVSSKTKEARYLHIAEDGKFDEVQFVDWIRQASRMPGEKM